MLCLEGGPVYMRYILTELKPKLMFDFTVGKFELILQERIEQTVNPNFQQLQLLCQTRGIRIEGN